MTVSERVLEEALSLPADARLKLIEKLVDSLNLPVDPEIERLWAEEAERRVVDIEAGRIKLLPGDEVFSRAKAKYSR
jgi:putative addiction module component (TIGR02574 family)